MFKVRTLVALAAAAVLAACATPPAADTVTLITNACASDAAVRPIVDTLLDVPGLATAAESQAVTIARGVIDPICANPSASPSTNAMTIVTLQSAKIVDVIVALRERQKKPAPAASSPS